MTQWLNEDLIFPSVKAYIDRVAKGLNLPPVVVLQNMIIRRLAEENAAADVLGQGEFLLSEFIEKDGELVTGEELYSIIYKKEKESLEREELARIEGRLQHIGFDRLPDNEQELLKRYKMDPESKDQKQKDNDDIQALIDSGDLILDDNQIQPKDKKSIYEP